MVECANCDHAHLVTDDNGERYWFCDIMDEQVDADDSCDDWVLVHGKLDI